MKRVLTLLLMGTFAAPIASFAQCTVTGLSSFYCLSDTGTYTLSASCSGGNPQFYGAGMTGNDFSPSEAGAGDIPIIVQSGTTTYTVSQSGTFAPISLTNATGVTLGDDQVSSSCSIGFNFRFFDNSYSTFYISSNGFITFDNTTANGCCSGQFLPNSSTPNNLIAAAWEDLNPNSGGTITYQTVGTAPNRRCCINYNGVAHYGGGYNVTTQIQLHEGCGRIEIHTTSMPTDGGSHTQGIENSSGSVAYYVSGRNASGSWSLTNDFVSFQPTCGDTFWTYVSPGPVLAMSTDSVACFDDTDGSLTVGATGESPFTYLWSTSATTATISGLGGGNFTCSVTDNDGCVAIATGTVDSPQPIGSVINTSDAFCESSADGSIEIYPTGGVPPYSIAWSNGGSGNQELNAVPGTYTFTVTDANGCTAVVSDEVGFVNEDPIVNLGNDRTICPNQQIVLVAPPGYQSYVWNDLSTNNALAVSQAGTYSLTATNAAGCFGYDSVEVTAVQPDQVDLGPNQNSLGPIVLDAGPQYTSYLWNTGAPFQMISVTINGNYSVTVIDSNGCRSSDTVNVKVWPTGVTAIEDEQVKVYPNPASTYVAVRSDVLKSNISLQLFDVNGRMVVNQQVNLNAGEELRVDVANIPAGNYMLKLNGDELESEHIISIVRP